MVNIETINQEILELERNDTTFATCERLAWLYIVKDHLTPAENDARKISGKMAGSAFLTAASGVDVEALLGILDDHMEAIKVLYPKEYAAILQRIKDLK